VGVGVDSRRGELASGPAVGAQADPGRGFIPGAVSDPVGHPGATEGSAVSVDPDMARWD
jgi:hypothetical protein